MPYNNQSELYPEEFPYELHDYAESFSHIYTNKEIVKRVLQYPETQHPKFEDLISDEKS